MIEVTVLHVDGCPNSPITEARLREALDRVGRRNVTVTRHRVDSLEQAEALAFRGSPTILVDGRDPFADRLTPIGLTCRIYRSVEGRAGAPTVDQLIEVLTR